jgi:hypothetical protein
MPKYVQFTIMAVGLWQAALCVAVQTVLSCVCENRSPSLLPSVSMHLCSYIFWGETKFRRHRL